MPGGETLWSDDDDGGIDDSEDDVIDVEGGELEQDNGGNTAPVPTEHNSVVRPVENIDEVVKVYNEFDEIKKRLLDSSQDIQKIGNNNHIKKSGWRKIATAFNLSVETADVKKAVEDGIIKYTVKARATAPNGKSVTGLGMCGSNESNHMEKLEEGGDWHKDDDDVFYIDGSFRRLKDPRAVNEHNVLTIAETRAKNRAISDLVGGGEVSAEEMKSMMLE